MTDQTALEATTHQVPTPMVASDTWPAAENVWR